MAVVVKETRGYVKRPKEHNGKKYFTLAVLDGKDKDGKNQTVYVDCSTNQALPADDSQIEIVTGFVRIKPANDKYPASLGIFVQEYKELKPAQGGASKPKPAPAKPPPDPFEDAAGADDIPF